MTEDYYGSVLPKNEAEILFQFEELLGKPVPLKKHLSSNSFGYALTTGRIVGHVGKLCVNEQQLKEIPNKIDNLQYLTTFELSNNRLRELPERIGKLCRLKKLILTYNGIN